MDFLPKGEETEDRWKAQGAESRWKEGEWDADVKK